MARYAGLWLDYSRALVVILTEGSEELVEIESGIGRGEHVPGGTCHNPREQPDKGAALQKGSQQLGRFFEQILRKVAGTEGILILGSGAAKQEFLNFVRAQYGPAGKRHGTKPAHRIDGQDFYHAVRTHFAATMSRGPRGMQP